MLTPTPFERVKRGEDDTTNSGENPNRRTRNQAGLDINDELVEMEPPPRKPKVIIDLTNE
jgi:hypothetical protein